VDDDGQWFEIDKKNRRIARRRMAMAKKALLSGN
jgi:hypothetical protein